MNSAQLLAVVEVPHDDRVRCQAAGCNHPVFRRIHVVRENSLVHVYGSECFKKLFLGLPVASSTPKYTSSEGRQLTEEERQLLIENTERLIQQFEAEYQAELARKATLTAIRHTPASAPAMPAAAAPIQQVARKPAGITDTALRHAAETQAKRIVRLKYGVDPELPGWRGLVIAEMERILNVG
jgi:hypothetical protein